MADLGDMKVKVSADVSEAIDQLIKLKRNLFELAKETSVLSAEYKKNAKELRELESAQNTGIGITNKTAGRIGFLKEQQEQLTFTIVKNKEALKLGSLAIKDFEKSSINASHGTDAISKAIGQLTNFSDVAAHSIKSFGREILHVIPSLAFGAVAGLASLITEKVITAFEDWFNAVGKVNDAIHLLKANQENLNDINAEANKDASKQIASLDILYKSATNVNLSMKDRLDAVKGLQNEFPDLFANISKETILNGGAEKQYLALAESIKATARAKAAVGKIGDLVSKQLDNDIERQKVVIATTKELNAAQAKLGTTQQIVAGLGVTAASQGLTKTQVQEIIKNRRDLRLGVIDENNKFLKSQIDFITKFIGLPDLSKVVEADIKVPKIKKEGIVKDVETIDDVLDKLDQKIAALNRREIDIKVSQSGAKITEIENAITHLIDKFKLTDESSVIINLKAKINDIQLTEEFKKILKFDKNKPIVIPQEIQLEMLPSEIKFPPGTFDEAILRDAIIKKLTDLGITKTIPIKIGIDIIGADIIAGSEDIGKSVSTAKLEATLKHALGNLKDFNGQVSQVLNELNAQILEGIGTAIGNAFSGQSDVVKGLFDTIFATLGTALQQLGKIAIETGIGIRAIKVAFKTLNPFVAIAAGIGLIALGTLIKNSIGSLGGFAKGGEVKGPGTGTSDSIPIMASAGEFVIQQSVVKKFGLSFFQKINKGIKPESYVQLIQSRDYSTSSVKNFTIFKKLNELVTSKIPIKIDVVISKTNLAAVNKTNVTDSKNVSTLNLTSAVKKSLEEIKYFNSIVSSKLKNVNESILENKTVKSFNKQVDNMEKVVNVISSTLQSTFHQLRKVTTETIKENIITFKTLTTASKLGVFATGGEIKGRGNGTSDSVLIRASAGEYIIRSSVVKQLGLQFFQRLNQGIKPLNYQEFIQGRGYPPRFAGGGLVTPNIITNNQQGALSLISTNETQVIIPDVKVRGQDLVLVFNRANATINRNS